MRKHAKALNFIFTATVSPRVIPFQLVAIAQPLVSRGALTLGAGGGSTTWTTQKIKS